MDQSRRERLAHNEGIFRSINEDLEGGLRGVEREEGELAGFVCECSERECSALVHVDPAKYEEVRTDSRRFLVLPGHEQAEVEDVVDSGERYSVVQKHADVTQIVERDDRRNP